MDALLLSRWQFAVASFFHFLFVPLTLGLSVMVAMMETKYVRTGDETYKRMAKFWGRLFIINFALGVVTGITLEFQFGTNWARYSSFVGDIFGSLLAVEATVAFFLESTFLAVWIFGWDRLSKVMHNTAIWIVAVATNLSAIWILLANGFMQNPVGYVIRNGRAELDSFFKVVTNGFGWSQFFHTVSGSWMLAGFFVMGISAWHLLRNNEVDFFKRSFKFGAAFAIIFSVLVAAQGHHHGNQVARLQPTKLAAMESLWETEKP
ncbi:MAG: cytochrome ubiquinol oxidase subunit I, partial [Desulfovibrio sp.]|nr:cytochrome ubiquinol oxidase subunit I [Desulfovibrio sp.]